MFQGITVVAGPARCGKTRRLLSAYRQVLASEPPGPALWLGPAYRTVAAVRQQLLVGGLPGCLSPNCLTFDQFARRVLERSDLPGRAISQSQSRQVLRDIVARSTRQGTLRYFAPIADKPGFLDLLAGFVQELKRLEIWPEEFAQACGRRAREKERELGQLYAEYQRVLTEHGLYDAQGRFWAARGVLREGDFRPFDSLRHVFVDGFTDLTRTEHEMLELLASRAQSLTISLPWEEGTQRQELFARTVKTLDELKRRHRTLKVESMAARAGSWLAQSHVERHLFANPRAVVAADDTTGIEILACAGAPQEIEVLAARIKQLLVEGDAASGGPVPAGDILVAFRSLEGIDDVVREIFTQFGIPFSVGVTPPLARSAVVQAAVGWLRLHAGDWPFRSLLAMLGHSYFRPEWSEWRDVGAVANTERLVRQLQLPRGRQQLLAAVDEMRAPGAAALLQRISAVFETLPSRATVGEWFIAVSQVMAELGVIARPDQSRQSSPDELADAAAWRQLGASVESIARLSAWMAREPDRTTLNEFIEILQDVAAHETLPVAGDEAGRVRVLSAENARNLSAPYVFLAGLSERSFPPPDREDCLSNEIETGLLLSAGLPLVSAAERRSHEMLLFYELVTRATRQLILSYPALDATAQPLCPSPYLEELERACGKGRITTTQHLDLSGIPIEGQAYSVRDFRVRAVARLAEGQGGLLAGLRNDSATIATANNMIAGLLCAHERSASSYGTFEGMLRSPEVAAQLRARFGPERCWSPSQLEQYARCPFQFFLQRILHLQPLDEPALEADHRNRGWLLHWLLAKLHRDLNADGRRRSPTDDSQARFLTAAQKIVQEIEVESAANASLAAGMKQIDARRVHQWLLDYWRQHTKYDETTRAWPAPLRPAHFEVRFGPKHTPVVVDPGEIADTEDPLSSSEPFALECGDENVLFAGRIDRIDLGATAGQPLFTVVDYKSRPSARTKAEAVAAGYSLQLPLYALAAEQLLAAQGALPFRAAYWHVGGKGHDDVVSFRVEEDGELSIDSQWREQAGQLRRRVRSLIEGIRGGEFPMHSIDQQCTSFCDFSTICRVNHARALEKQWTPPSLEVAVVPEGAQ